MSGLNTDLLSNRLGTGPANLFKQWAAKAWANLNGTGTIALRDSENVSSAVDNGTGDYTFNFTNAMASVGYVAGESGATGTTFENRVTDAYMFVGSLRVTCINNNASTFQDNAYVGIANHGDLA